MCISVLRVVRTKVWICPLKQPESAQTRIIFTLWATWVFFFFNPRLLWRIFTGRKPWHLLLYAHFLHLLVISTGRRWERGAKTKNAHRRIERSAGWEAPVFNYALYTGNKYKEGSIILASMLWSQNTNTFIFFCLFAFFFLLLLFSIAHFSWSKSQSFHTLIMCLSQYWKKVGLL